jgi:hypothetical protein
LKGNRERKKQNEYKENKHEKKKMMNSDKTIQRSVILEDYDASKHLKTDESARQK